MCNLRKVLPSAKGRLQSLDFLKLHVYLTPLESATALLSPDFVFRNNSALYALGKVAIHGLEGKTVGLLLSWRR